MIDVVGDVFRQYEAFPGWAYVEETLEREGLDAVAVLATMPRETHNYSYVWPVRQTGPFPQDRLGLTIAGLYHVTAGTRSLVDAFVNFVGALGTLRSRVALDPFANEHPKVMRADVHSIVVPSPVFEPTILELMRKEPATWQCQVNRTAEAGWTIELPPEIRHYAGIASVEEYLDRLHEQVAPPEEPQLPTFVSPFTLPASIDYLDIVWRLRFGDQLVVPPSVERSSRLAFDATSAEEVESFLSALAELLKSLNVPGVVGRGGHPLERLGPFLDEQLPPEARERVTLAIAVLNAARKIRTGAQHYQALPNAVDAHAVLGLPYPVADWPSAWRQIRIAAGNAFDALRDEIRGSV